MEILLLISLLALVVGMFWFTSGSGSNYGGTKFEQPEDKNGMIRNNH
jgi:flagellar basal body-associated protein FliL